MREHLSIRSSASMLAIYRYPRKWRRTCRVLEAGRRDYALRKDTQKCPMPSSEERMVADTRLILGIRPYGSKFMRARKRLRYSSRQTLRLLQRSVGASL